MGMTEFELLKAKAVCRVFRDVVRESPMIQRKLFLTLLAPTLQTGKSKFHINHMIFKEGRTCSSSQLAAYLKSNPDSPQSFTSRLSMPPTKFALAWDMFLTQPPVKEATLVCL